MPEPEPYLPPEPTAIAMQLSSSSSSSSTMTLQHSLLPPNARQFCNAFLLAISRSRPRAGATLPTTFGQNPIANASPLDFEGVMKPTRNEHANTKVIFEHMLDSIFLSRLVS